MHSVVRLRSGSLLRTKPCLAVATRSYAVSPVQPNLDFRSLEHRTKGVKQQSNNQKRSFAQEIHQDGLRQEPSPQRPALQGEPRGGDSGTLSLKSWSSGQVKAARPPADTRLVQIEIEGEQHWYSPLLLRDLCACPLCIDTSTKQKHFSTADIPANIQAEVLSVDSDKVHLRWTHDIPGYDGHATELSVAALQNLNRAGNIRPAPRSAKRVFWNTSHFQQQPDFDYEAYMSDDSVLLKALQQLHTHGLLFVSNVPDSEGSVSTIGERIGPLKTTFYGKTWDVRSVPEAKNVAYTAQNLGFHMDLMYMKQPPHLQLLHCIRSSSAGGASLFTDSLRAAHHLYQHDYDAFTHLSELPIEFHYDHVGSQYYHQTRTVIEQSPVSTKTGVARDLRHLEDLRSKHPSERSYHDLGFDNFVESVAWAPPFQGPFALTAHPTGDFGLESAWSPSSSLSTRVQKWHSAAQKFNALIEDPEVIYERLMKPGECVIFDNRRVLHARKAFEVGDAGKERWLRGAYIDKDPYVSKTRVLTEQLQHVA